MSRNLFVRMSVISWVILASAFILPGVIVAEVPHMLKYQGRLTDDLGNPMNATVAMVFKVFDDSVGGSVLWTETNPAVTVTDGLFDVKLGSITPIGNTVFNGSQRWLGISIDGGDILQPMTPLVSTAYSLRSQRTDTATYAAFSATAVDSDTADYAANAGHATTSQHADTADIALNAGNNGWTDAGSVVSLTTLTDSVGIGTIDPRVPLEVQGDVTAIMGESHGSGLSIGVLGGNNNNGIGVMGSSNDGRGVSGISTTGFGGHFYGPKSYISSNLGIGTEAPEEMVHIYKNSSGASNYLKIQSAHGSNWGETGLRFETPQNIWHFRMDDDANNNMPSGGLGLRSHNLDAEVMTWRENGNVGIGTTSPNYPLEVVSSENTLRARCTGSGIGVYASSLSGFGVYSDATKNFMGGLTGFGQTNPTHKITVNGAIGIQQSGTTKYHFNYYNNGFNISETNVADYRLYIKAGGNVGIGTSNPTAKLHVAGTLHADAFEADAIGRSNIVDEVGIASASASTTIDLTTSYSSVLTKQITIPTAGYILAIGCVYTHIDHNIADLSYIRVAFSDQSDNLNGGMSYSVNLWDNVSAGDYRLTIPCQRLFYESSAGTYTYYMIARYSPNGTSGAVFNRQMDLIFLPTAYGSKDGVVISDPDENIFTAPADFDVNPDLSRTLQDSKSNIKTSSGGETGALVNRIETLTAEIEALKNRMLTLENK